MSKSNSLLLSWISLMAFIAIPVSLNATYEFSVGAPPALAESAPLPLPRCASYNPRTCVRAACVQRARCRGREGLISANGCTRYVCRDFGQQPVRR